MDSKGEAGLSECHNELMDKTAFSEYHNELTDGTALSGCLSPLYIFLFFFMRQ
jgi:hypothetical protein